MKNSWESTVTLNNAILWALSAVTGLAAVQMLIWATLGALTATETLVMSLTS
ncbi:hypothetical protein LOC68_12800 [Blastopirellula sp. JC732]|uniref:Uncharacterized protein n=1 Tax=Blastopirellula sediminis TaxID=2894196 RepID=A0A9X1SFJ5_9BACT|nr:hypothetical protein [Blastopirellula sediminis]MCC9607432.1 hypothetical protein [Blastopirellula sediminis]MCC9629275.1 hypothetical protein [Blastopirellula sediminis]